MKVLPLFLCILTSSFFFWGCSGDSEVDALLDSYEEMIEEIERISGKGDASLDDMQSFNEKLTDFSKKLEASQSDSEWSMGQFTRYAQLMSRHSSAVSNMN